MTNFFWPSVGGILLGISATLLLLLTGRIAGISGILWGAITKNQDDRTWRWLFLAGLIGGAWLYHAISGNAYPVLQNNYLLAVCGGLLVGMGVKIGNGCTSGHGVCGIGRMSPRSISSTLIFMSVGIATVYVVRTVAGMGA